MRNYLYNRQSLYASHIALGIAILLWYLPITNHYWLVIDGAIFKLLNNSLIDAVNWQYFWGLLNHKREVWLNIVLAIGINIYAICTAAKGKKIKLLLTISYFILFLEAALFIQNFIVDDVLHIMRDSPSITLKAKVMLSETLNNPLIKDSSNGQSCFPAGHAFALLYWAGFTYYCCKKNIGYLAIFIAIFLCLPRLFSGAHWFSDVLVTGILSWLWLSWAAFLTTKFFLK